MEFSVIKFKYLIIALFVTYAQSSLAMNWFGSLSKEQAGGLNRYLPSYQNKLNEIRTLQFTLSDGKYLEEAYWLLDKAALKTEYDAAIKKFEDIHVGYDNQF